MRELLLKMAGGEQSPPRAKAGEIFSAWVGSCLAIACIALLERYATGNSGFPLLIGSFGASAVLAFGAIRSPLAQPRNLVGGHFLSALVGVSCYFLFPGTIWLASCLAVATAIGSWFGARFTLLPLFRIPVKMQKVSAASPLTQKPQQARRRFRLGMVIFFAMIGWGLLTAADHPALGLAMLFGIGFGLLIERAQICFTSAFRDMWITGRTVMAKAIIFGMAASAIGIFSYVQLGMAPKIMWAGPNAAIGGLLFGFGIVLAGGCETGWMYRAVEGQVHYWWVGLGNVIGSTLLAWCWDDIAAPLATHWQKINLLNAFGPFGGLLATYLLLLIALLLVIAWERHFFRRQSTAVRTVKESA